MTRSSVPKNKKAVLREAVSRRENSAFSHLLAKALADYASKDGGFKKLLFQMTAILPPPASGNSVPFPEQRVSMLAPKNPQRAREYFMWIFQNPDLPGAERALEMFASWHAAESATMPQAVVLGIKIGVLPIGIAGKMKIDEEMPIIARQDVVSPLRVNRQKFADLMVKTSASVVSKAYMAAGQDMRKIEPSIAEWFFGSKETRLFTGSASSLEKLVSELQRLKVIHSVANDENGPAVIATSPIVEQAHLELEYDLMMYEEGAAGE